jgi:hypothetical protein
LGEYLPEAPVDDQARERNGNLPGQGGVFNLVNLHVYHYAGNNPVKYTDPDGRDTIISFKVFGMDIITFNKPSTPIPPELSKFMRFIKGLGVERQKETDPFKFVEIADSWDDLPDEVKARAQRCLSPNFWIFLLNSLPASAYHSL